MGRHKMFIVTALCLASFTLTSLFNCVFVFEDHVQMGERDFHSDCVVVPTQVHIVLFELNYVCSAAYSCRGPCLKVTKHMTSIAFLSAGDIFRPSVSSSVVWVRALIL
jgi:hypothetical protein